MKLDFNFVKACKETEVELDGVISALGEKYIGPDTIVTYQDKTIEKYKIIGELGQNSIPDKTNAVKVEIGNKVTSIGDEAFYGCSNLSSITIPNTVTNIGYRSFRNCTKLLSITIPNSISSIDDRGWTFWNCNRLSSISMPNSITNIPTAMFFSCYNLSSIEIPSSVSAIKSAAFSNCFALSSITIPSGVISIEQNLIQYCTNISSIIVDENNPIFDSRNNCNGIIKKSNNELIVACKNTVIPNNVTSIGPYAFYGCTNLISISFPNSIEKINSYAFCDCSSLTSVIIQNDSLLTIISNSVFQKCTNLKMISLPSCLTEIGPFAFSQCSNLSSISCTATTAPYIYSSAFGDSNSYTGRNTYSTGNNVLTIPLGATGYDTSYWADPLQISSKCGFHIDYIIPEDHDETVVWYQNKTVSAYNVSGAFDGSSVQNMSDAVKIDIGDTVMSLNNQYSMFYDKTNLKNLIIPRSVSLIPVWCFNSTAFETITFKDRTISEVQSMQNYSSWNWEVCSHGISSMQRTIVCMDGTFTINAHENHEPE